VKSTYTPSQGNEFLLKDWSCFLFTQYSTRYSIKSCWRTRCLWRGIYCIPGVSNVLVISISHLFYSPNASPYRTSNVPTHGTITQALQALSCMEHRGASSADNISGDGAGINLSCHVLNDNVYKYNQVSCLPFLGNSFPPSAILTLFKMVTDLLAVRLVCFSYLGKYC